MGIYGQDWASYQPAEPSVTGIDFVIGKITEGLGYVNPKWTRQRDHAKANGLVWGAYHYPHMGNDAKKEADFFLRQVGWQPGDIIVLDWEGYDDANQGVSRARQLAYKEEWLRYVKDRMPGHPVGMYCNVDYWKNVDTTGYYGDFLWIATAGRPAGDPGIKAPWLFHQYKASPVDTNYCHLPSRAALRDWALSSATTTPTPPTAPVEEDPMAGFTPDDVAHSVLYWLNQSMAPTPEVPGGGHPLANVVPSLNAKFKAYDAVLAALPAKCKLTPAEIGQALADGTLKVTVTVAPSITPKAS